MAANAAPTTDAQQKRKEKIYLKVCEYQPISPPNRTDSRRKSLSFSTPASLALIYARIGEIYFVKNPSSTFLRRDSPHFLGRWNELCLSTACIAPTSPEPHPHLSLPLMGSLLKGLSYFCTSLGCNLSSYEEQHQRVKLPPPPSLL